MASDVTAIRIAFKRMPGPEEVMTEHKVNRIPP